MARYGDSGVIAQLPPPLTTRPGVCVADVGLPAPSFAANAPASTARPTLRGVSEIRCIECGRVAPPHAHAKGWRAYIVDDPDEPEEMEVAVYCVDCGEREFGQPEVA